MTNEEISKLKPSELIRLAVHDLELQENAPNSRVDMSEWVRTDETGCVACLAGSVMRHSLKLQQSPFEQIPAWATALDRLRQGNVHAYISLKAIGADYVLPVGGSISLDCLDYIDRSVDYGVDPEAFKLWCLLIAEILEEDNL